jgi:hypothetical protein
LQVPSGTELLSLKYFLRASDLPDPLNYFSYKSRLLHICSPDLNLEYFQMQDFFLPVEGQCISQAEPEPRKKSVLNLLNDS